MTAPTIYSYDPDTGLYVGTCQADPSPLEPDVWLYPAYTTDVEPPQTGEHEAAIWTGEAWQVVPDWRGHVYYTHDGERHEITELGVAPPDDALDEPPPPSLDELRAAAKTRIDAVAGSVRASYTSVGAYIDVEYKQAEAAAQVYADAGYPDDSVPVEVACWAEAAGLTAREAADDILAKATAWRQALAAIRQARLLGKAAVDRAPDDADFAAVAAPYIAQLEAIAEQAPED